MSKVKKTNNEIVGVDSPLINPKDDCLNREIFAKRIFKIINGTPLDSHIRVGIYGSWGEGKTSVLNFLKWYCEDAGHPVVLFKPWQFHNREEAWQGLVASIDKGIAEWNPKLAGNFRRKKIIKDISGKAKQLAKIAGTKLGQLIGELILSPLEGLLELTKEKVGKELRKILGNKRLYIFIDDLDRSDPEIIYESLMLLNEIFDLGRCIFVIALDVDVASEALKHKLGYIEPKEFFEKIINWPFELPVPSELDWQHFLETELKGFCKDINSEAMQTIYPLLPQNPRKIKHYLRYLSGLHKSFLSRFSKEELDWKVLYMAQLLRLEFPNEFKIIINNDVIIEDLEKGFLVESIRKTAFGHKEEKELSWQKNLKEKIGNDIVREKRFIELYSALRESSGIMKIQNFKNNLLVLEEPELLTWKEYYAFKDKLVKLTDPAITRKLKKFILDNRKARELERSREFVKMLLRDRQNRLSHIADCHIKKEMEQGLAEVEQIMRICFLLIDIDEIFSSPQPIFDKVVFKEWFSLLIHWAHFTEPSLYLPVREKERELLLKLARKICGQASILLNDVIREFGFSHVLESRKGFKPTYDQIVKILEDALGKDLSESFGRIDGIKRLWGHDHYFAEKKLLFTNHKSFHNKRNYKRLEEISAKAGSDPVIQKNFIEYLSMLFYSASGKANWVRKEDTIEILKDKNLLNIIWQAVISQPLNRRFVGSLEKDRKNTEKNILKDKKILAVPKWWEILIADEDIEERNVVNGVTI